MWVLEAIQFCLCAFLVCWVECIVVWMTRKNCLHCITKSSVRLKISRESFKRVDLFYCKLISEKKRLSTAKTMRWISRKNPQEKIEKVELMTKAMTKIAICCMHLSSSIIWRLVALLDGTKCMGLQTQSSNVPIKLLIELSFNFLYFDIRSKNSSKWFTL